MNPWGKLKSKKSAKKNKKVVVKRIGYIDRNRNVFVIKSLKRKSPITNTQYKD